MAFDLKIANPTLDSDLLATAREAAMAILEDDPILQKSENLTLRTLLARHAGKQKFDFSMIS
jgi:ATP-dependent DNA helicase RecG